MTDEKNKAGKPRAIVMPFQPVWSGGDNGTGMALHFLLGNVLVLNHNLKEMWFGWRVGKIFPDAKGLTAFCHGGGTEFDYHKLGQEQKVRFWFTGSIENSEVDMRAYDATDSAKNSRNRILFTTTDQLKGFRLRYMDWSEDIGIKFDPLQRDAALWPEEISDGGLAAVGSALEAFYLYSAFGGEGGIDTGPFDTAVKLSPNSFMAQDLLGWALYRNEAYAPAKTAFLKALRVNPHGAGAMAGMM